MDEKISEQTSRCVDVTENQQESNVLPQTALAQYKSATFLLTGSPQVADIKPEMSFPDLHGVSKSPILANYLQVQPNTAQLSESNLSVDQAGTNGTDNQVRGTNDANAVENQEAEEKAFLFICGKMIADNPNILFSADSARVDYKSKAQQSWSNVLHNYKDNYDLSAQKLANSFEAQFYAAVWLFHFESCSEFTTQLSGLLTKDSEHIVNLMFGFCNDEVQESMNAIFGAGKEITLKLDYIPCAIKEHTNQRKNDSTMPQRVHDWIKIANNQHLRQSVLNALPHQMKQAVQNLFRDLNTNKTIHGRVNPTTEEIRMAVEYRVDYVNTLAKGTNGARIYIGKRISSKKMVAVKSVDPEFYRQPQHEKLILNECDCEFIVQFYGVFELDRQTNFFLELCGGDVNKWVACKNGKDHKPINLTTGKYRNDTQFLEYFDITSHDIVLQSLEGLAYLHKLNIVHRDIKPENFLLKKRNDGKVCVKVTDFGLSRMIQPGKSAYDTEGAGTESYRAPECYGGNVQAKLSNDIFSFGVYTFYVFTLGKYMFGDNLHCHKGNIIDEESKTTVKVTHLLRGKNSSICLTEEQRITACDSIKKMVRYTPEARPRIEDVKQHPAYWDTGRKLEFFKTVSGVLKKINKEEFNMHTIEYMQEKKGHRNEDTQEKHQKVKFDVTTALPTLKTRSYGDKKCDGIEDIIRTMRNKLVHAHDLPAEEQQLLGLEPGKEDYDFFLQLFLKKVPHLLIHCYDFFAELGIFTKYFKSSPSNNEA